MIDKSIIEKLKNTDNPKLLIEEICSEIRNLEPKEGKEIFEALIVYVKENNLYSMYPLVITQYSWIQYELGNFEESIKLNLEAIELYKEQNNINGMLSPITLLVGFYSSFHIFHKAVEYSIIGIELAEKTSNFKMLYSLKANIGIIYLELEEFEKAKEIFEQVLKIPNVGVKTNKAPILLNLSECELELKNYDEALKRAEEALEITKELSSKLTSYAYVVLGRIYTALGDNHNAEKNFKDGVEIARKGNQTLHFNDGILFWAILELKCEKYEEALNKLLLIDEENIRFNSIRNKIVLYEKLNEIYKTFKIYEKAYYYIEKLRKIEIDFYRNKVEAVKNIKEISESEENKNYKILYDETELLYTVGQEITSNLNREDIYNIIEKEIKKLFKCNAVQIAILNGEKLEYQLCVEDGKRLGIESISINKDSLGTYSFRNKQDILINDVEKEYYQYVPKTMNKGQYIVYGSGKYSDEITKSMIFIPIIESNEVIGIISVQSYEKNAYDLKDVNKLKILSTYLAIALENSRYYKEIKYNATYDALTKVYNRRTILNKIENIFYRTCKLESSELENYIIMIDVDNFKGINDTFGHIAGDSVLGEVASAIENTLNEGELVGRYGGEEFIVVINRSKNEALDVAEEIRYNIENIDLKSEKNGKLTNVNVTASIGMAIVDRELNSLNDTINKADKCLYIAKNTGKNRVVF